MTYDTAYAGLYFPNDTLRFSFGVSPMNVHTTEYMIPVYLVGTPTDAKREIGYKIVAEGTTATEGQQFKIGEACVGADSIHGYLPVTLYRDALAGNYQDGYVKYRLTLQLTGNSCFTPTLSAKNQVCVFLFDNAVEQPEWYDYKGDKVWSEYEFGVWHPLKLIKMVEYFHGIADIQPETYAKMVQTYGENLEHVEYGDFYQYRTIMRKYVFKPMYDYFSDPANRDVILATYPDFPFDFPDPFA